MNDTTRLAAGSDNSSYSDTNTNRQHSKQTRRNKPNTSRKITSNNRDTNNSDDDQNARQQQPDNLSSESSKDIKYGAKNVVQLFIPVSLCIAIVVGTMKATNSYKYGAVNVIWYAVMYTDQSVDTGTRIWQSFANAFMLLGFIVIMTTLLIFLYIYRCYKVIHIWLILSSLMLLFMFTLMYISEMLKVYNVPMDAFTISIFIWNFGIVGMISIHWKGPLLLQQAYLITISALMALVFIRALPDWTIWTVLAIISIWDLVAVLCPRGPLRILVETAQERNEQIFPALIYSSAMMWEIGTSVFSSASIATSTINMADSKKSNSNFKGEAKSSRKRSNRTMHNANMVSSTTERREQHPVEIRYDDEIVNPEVTIIQPSLSGINVSTSANNGWTHAERASTVRESLEPNDMRSEDQEEEERGVKLGLGDFIFFSILVGKASSFNDWTVTISCYVAILVGLCLTLTLLAVFKKALPALPISVVFGISAFFLSYSVAIPFASELSLNQIFI